LKKLEYLNLALNNIEAIENLEGWSMPVLVWEGMDIINNNNNNNIIQNTF